MVQLLHLVAVFLYLVGIKTNYTSFKLSCGQLVGVAAILPKDRAKHNYDDFALE